MRNRSGIYAIWNSRVDRFYVGGSINVKQRWKCHKTDLRGGRHHSAKLQEGKTAWIAENGAPFQGRKHTKEARLKMSESLKGREPWNKGIPLSEETRAKLSEALKGREVSDYSRRQASQVHRGEGNTQSKLSRCEVLAILSEYEKSSTSQAELGRRYGISQAQVHHIVTGKSWRHVYAEFKEGTNV